MTVTKLYKIQHNIRKPMTYRLSLEQPAITTPRTEVTSSKRALGQGRDHTCGRQPRGKFHGGTFCTKHKLFHPPISQHRKTILRIIRQLARTVQVEFPGLAPVQRAPCFIGTFTFTSEVPATISDLASTASGFILNVCHRDPMWSKPPVIGRIRLTDQPRFWLGSLSGTNKSPASLVTVHRSQALFTAQLLTREFRNINRYLRD